jgi:hypothetical protein
MGSDGRYNFNSCVPDGDMDIANVKSGDVINRAWTFRVNEVPKLQSLLDNGVFDPRHIARGEDGIFFAGDGTLLAEVNEFQARVSFKNSDYQAAGKKITWAIPQGFTVTLTFTETVIRDAELLAKIFAALEDGAADAVLNFQGVIRSRA